MFKIVLDIYVSIKKGSYMELNKDRKQLNFDIHPELHKKIKIAAASRNISMALYLQRAIIEKLEREKIVHQET
jgi:predicted HicB family RNase H-like nuclease